MASHADSIARQLRDDIVEAALDILRHRAGWRCQHRHALHDAGERRARALRAFADRFPPDRILELGTAAVREQRARYGYPVDDRREEFYGVLAAVAKFKSSYPINT